MIINPLGKNNALKGEITVAGDKSVSHRAVMIGSLADGLTEVTGFLSGEDCMSTISCFREMGIEIEADKVLNRVLIHGKGLFGLSKPKTSNVGLPAPLLYAGNSGTTVRLMSGILAAQSFDTCISGDDSIKKRPMNRVITPLSLMGADISGAEKDGFAPLYIRGKELKPIDYVSPIASAQIKSAVLLAGLFARGDKPTTVSEPYKSRNHSEIMLKHFGANITEDGNTVSVFAPDKLTGQKIVVPGDISSAAYFIAAALIVPRSEILVRRVGINPTRDGIIRVLIDMGADITLLNKVDKGGEAYADILVRHSELRGTEIGADIIPALIDEIPVIAVIAAFANGKTVISGAEELKVKESNRIDTVVSNLAAMGADITATADGMIINGGKALYGAFIETKSDHRIAMSFAIAALMADGETTLSDGECASISYPEFYEDLRGLVD